MPDGRSAVSSTLRVCIAAHSFAIGGGEIAPVTLANALRRRGHAVFYLVVDDADLRGERHVAARLDPAIPVFRWDGRRETIEAFLAANDVELVNSHNLSVDFRLYRAGVQALPRYVASMHGGYESTPQCMTPGFLRYIQRVDRWLYLAEKNLPPLRRGGVDPAKFALSFNAVEPAPLIPADRRAVRARYGLADSAFVLALASRATQDKGWEIAVEVARRLQGRGRDVRLVLAGEGPAAEALRMRGPEPFVSLAGHVDAVPDLLSACDLAIFPSTFAGESMPLFLLECFAAGLPALATDLGRIPDMFGAARDEQPGRVFASSLDAEALTNAMAGAAAEALFRPDGMARWRGAARRRAACFEIEALADLYEASFRAVLADRRPARDAETGQGLRPPTIVPLVPARGQSVRDAIGEARAVHGG